MRGGGKAEVDELMKNVELLYQVTRRAGRARGARISML